MIVSYLFWFLLKLVKYYAKKQNINPMQGKHYSSNIKMAECFKTVLKTHQSINLQIFPKNHQQVISQIYLQVLFLPGV